MKNLKQKTLSGLIWSFIETTSSQLIGFISTIVLARILSPSDFGLIGMTIVITALAQIFSDGGLSQALIRKQDCKDVDYSTVFIINTLIGISVYIIIFFLAPMIARFFNQPSLVSIIRVISISIPFNSLSIIQRTLITKKIDFKTQALISVIGAFFGFGVAIVLAIKGYGVWSLVYRSVIAQFVMLVLLWVLNNWRPKFVFSKKSFQELFGFGSNLLVIYSIATIFKNIYNIVIGKFYNSTILGYYTNADQMSGLPAGILTTLFNKVAYPVLSSMQNNDVLLKYNIRKLEKPLLLITFTFMLFLAAIANSFIPLLFGNKWIMSVPYFQILCVAYMPSILHTVNQLIMNVKGQSRLFLITEIVKYIFFIPVVYLGIKYGVLVLLFGFMIHYWFGFIINASFSNKLIGYSIPEQIKDLSLPLFFAIIVSIFTYSIYMFTSHLNHITILFIQTMVALTISFLLLRYVRVFDYEVFFQTIKDFFYNSTKKMNESYGRFK